MIADPSKQLDIEEGTVGFTKFVLESKHALRLDLPPLLLVNNLKSAWNRVVLMCEEGEVTVCMQDGLLFHLVVGKDGLIIDEEGVCVGDGFVLGDIVQLEGHAVCALVQHGMPIEEFRGNQVLDYFAIPHPLSKLIIIINYLIIKFIPFSDISPG